MIAWNWRSYFYFYIFSAVTFFQCQFAGVDIRYTISCLFCVAVVSMAKANKLKIFAISNFLLGLVGFLNTNVYVANSAGQFVLAYLSVLFMHILYMLVTSRLSRVVATYSYFTLSLMGLFCLPYFSYEVRLAGILWMIRVWHSAYLIRYFHSVKEMGWIRFLSSQPGPFAPLGFPPIPGLVYRFFEKDDTENEKLIFQKEAIYIAILSLVLNGIFNWQTTVSYQYPIIQQSLISFLGAEYKFNFLDNFASFNQLALSEKWLVLILSFANFWLRVAGLSLLTIASFRFMGVRLKMPIYDLLGAKTFYQFLERYNYYYCQMMMDLFVQPLVQKLRFLNQQLRVRTGLFFGIILAGIFYHTLFRGAYSKIFLAYEFFNYFLPLTSYWFVLAVLSLWWRSPLFSDRFQFKGIRYVNFISYFLIAAVLHFFIRGKGGPIEFKERLELIASMFGI